MGKRRVCVVIALVLLLLSQLVLAEPSDWAENFVNKANAASLVPESLNNQYQSNIKRYEYVQIALNVLEKHQVQDSTITTNPFSDIENPVYKQDIINAYHLGIISGYSDGTFRPEAEISREEVAALVYNLVKKINAEVTLPQTQALFSDSDLISQWAVPFVSYNFDEGIISGVGMSGGLVTVNPKGKTTREQAIILLYKVYSNNQLLGKVNYDHPVIKTVNAEKDTVNAVASKLGHHVMDVCMSLVESNDMTISQLEDYFIGLTYKNENKIQVYSKDDEKQLCLYFKDLKDEQAVQDTELIGKAFFGNEFNLEVIKPLIDKYRSGELDSYEFIEKDNYRYVLDYLDDELIIAIIR